MNPVDDLIHHVRKLVEAEHQKTLDTHMWFQLGNERFHNEVVKPRAELADAVLKKTASVTTLVERLERICKMLGRDYITDRADDDLEVAVAILRDEVGSEGTIDEQVRRLVASRNEWREIAVAHT